MSVPGDNDQRAEQAMDRAREIASPLQGIDAGRITRGGGGADIGPLMRAGVPGFGLQTTGERYFHWHHSEADTLDKVDPINFRRAVAALGVFCYGLADMPGRL
jgi:carboxypeptidase Q